jgi:hypothetical protein
VSLLTVGAEDAGLVGLFVLLGLFMLRVQVMPLPFAGCFRAYANTVSIRALSFFDNVLFMLVL